MEQRTDVATFGVLHHGSAMGVAALERHGQPCLTEGQTIGIKVTDTLFHLAQGDSGKAIAIRLMKIVIDVKGIKGGIGSGKEGTKTKSSFDLFHQREEVRDVGEVEGLRAFSEDKFTDPSDFGGDHTRGIAPVV